MIRAISQISSQWQAAVSSAVLLVMNGCATTTGESAIGEPIGGIANSSGSRMAVLATPSSNLADTPEFSEIIALIKDGDRQEQRSQQRIDQLDDQCTALLNNFRADKKQLEAINRYNRLLIRNIGAQEEEIARLSGNEAAPTPWKDEIGPSEGGLTLTGKHSACSLDQKATDINYPMPISADETLTFDRLAAITKVQQQNRLQINNARESAFLKARNDQRAALNAVRNAVLKQERRSTMLEEVMSKNQQIIEELEFGGNEDTFSALFETPLLARQNQADESAETSKQQLVSHPSLPAQQHQQGAFPGSTQASQNADALLANWHEGPGSVPDSEAKWSILIYSLSESERPRDAYATFSLAYLAGRLSTGANLRNLVRYAAFFDNPYTAASILERELAIGRLTAELDNLTFQAQVLSQAREHARAISVLSRAAEIDPSGGTSYKLGQVLLADEQHEAAEAALTNALAKGLETEEDTGEAWLLLGVSIFSQAGPDDSGTWRRARSAFVEAQKFESSRARANQWVTYIDAVDETYLRQQQIAERQAEEEAAAAGSTSQRPTLDAPPPPPPKANDPSERPTLEGFGPGLSKLSDIADK